MSNKWTNLEKCEKFYLESFYRENNAVKSEISMCFVESLYAETK